MGDLVGQLGGVRGIVSRGWVVGSIQRKEHADSEATFLM